ncbi:MAG: chromate resistance protein ChrB domain-containing protein [Pseudomonadota bacterium]
MINLRQVAFLSAVVLFLSALSVLMNPEQSMGQQRGPVFSSWEGFEADKCASIWLIKRFINKNAIFRFYPKGEVAMEGTAFDTPDAKFRRYHNMSTFESILKHYNLQDPALVHIGRIMHDIEVNIWEQKIMPETVRVQNEINRIILNHEDRGETIEKSCRYFDALYREVAARCKESQ